MTTLPRRPFGAIAVLALALAVVLAACGAGAASQPPPTASDLPSTVVELDALVADPGLDGTSVSTQGMFLATGETAQLCSIMLESYPPQCGGGTVRIVGEVPADVLAAMDSTASEPDLAQATWGFVDVTGTYRVSGADGQPTIELGSIALVPAGG